MWPGMVIAVKKRRKTHAAARPRPAPGARPTRGAAGMAGAGSTGPLCRPPRPHEPEETMRMTAEAPGRMGALSPAESRPRARSALLAGAMRVVPLLLLLLTSGASPAFSQATSSFKVVAESASGETISDIPVFLTDRVGENLSHIYQNVGREIPLCLFGTEGRERLVVRRVGLPRIDSATDSTAVFSGRGCQAQSDFLGYVHNHFKSSPCRPSLTDTRRFLLDKEPRIELVACPRAAKTIYHALVKDQTLSAER